MPEPPFPYDIIAMPDELEELSDKYEIRLYNATGIIPILRIQQFKPFWDPVVRKWVLKIYIKRDNEFPRVHRDGA